MPTKGQDWIQRQIQAIRDDHRSGSLALTRKAGAALMRLAARGSGNARELRRRLSFACRSLVAAQPQMASLWNLCNEVLVAADGDSQRADPMEATIRAAVTQFLERLEEQARAASATAAGLLKDGKIVMTHSYSSMVRDAILHAAARGTRLRVLVTESRPLLEGVRLSEELTTAGIPVTLGVDALVAAFVEQADVVLVGADMVCAGGLVNKIGTCPIALAARETNTACYALAVAEKFMPAGFRPVPETDQSAQEVVRRVPKGVQVRNRYFEPTPLRWFSGIVTEEGTLGANQVFQRLRRLRLHRELELARESFGDCGKKTSRSEEM